MKTNSNQHRAGFTLMEGLLAAAITSALFGMLMTGAVALQRTYLAADFQASAQNEQLRVCDYLARDLQSASSVSITGGGSSIDVTLPDPNQNVLSTNLNIPILGQLLQNQTPSTPHQVHYTYSSGELARVDGTDNTRIAQRLTRFTVARSGAQVFVEAAFTPKFSRRATPYSIQINRTICLRNISS
jgi:type II secretory pathway component PulJ